MAFPLFHLLVHGSEPGKKINKRSVKGWIVRGILVKGVLKELTHMVQHPCALLKMGETIVPISPQRIGGVAALNPPPPFSPNLSSKHVTKFGALKPQLVWDLTESSKVLAMSNKASASGTCSLGFWTENPIGCAHLLTSHERKKKEARSISIPIELIHQWPVHCENHHCDLSNKIPNTWPSSWTSFYSLESQISDFISISTQKHSSHWFMHGPTSNRFQ